MKDGKHYIGYTNDIQRRLEEHNSGKNKSTRHRRPFKIIYKEQFFNLSEARQREREIKKYKGGNEFKKLINKLAQSY
jgi:putative endonuclease